MEDIGAIILHLQEDEDEIENHEVTVAEAVREEDIIGSKAGLQTYIAENISPFEAFSRFVDDDDLGHIVCETNRITYVNGLEQASSIQSSWSTKPIYQNAIPANTMSRNRFDLLVFMIHFSDIETILPGNSEEYTWNSKVYSGKSENYDMMVGFDQTVCEELSQGLLNEGRTLFVDNFYISYELALLFLQHETHAVGTPLAICDYNKGKSGIDISDQMCSYATTLRKGVKWYRKLGIEYLLGMCIVNTLWCTRLPQKPTKDNSSEKK
ncbi:hypothetical protein PR048_008219 [Dryococelus australis]|uniref:PiggyBac transposable element-derived protein domain-containing protein n=1 Tax=Dryococelus australis TaxID=614101 RepID=A0ABQ9HWT9_9NEOP|nr:hypothetical protein PR048_008219 [Dryococelus australis]